MPCFTSATSAYPIAMEGIAAQPSMRKMADFPLHLRLDVVVVAVGVALEATVARVVAVVAVAVEAAAELTASPTRIIPVIV